jgi:hypothetical protein
MNPKVDLESAIMKVWQMEDDLDLFLKYHGDAPTPMTEDEVANTILGLKMIHKMRMWELNDTYCRKMELNQYCTDPEKLAARDFMFGTKQPKKGKKK